MKPKTLICVGNKAALDLYKKQDWWKSYIKNVLAQTYTNYDLSPIDQNSRTVKRYKLGALFCYRSTDTLSWAFLWRNTAEGHEFWNNEAQHMCRYGEAEASNKYAYTYPLNSVTFK